MEINSGLLGGPQLRIKSSKLTSHCSCWVQHLDYVARAMYPHAVLLKDKIVIHDMFDNI